MGEIDIIESLKKLGKKVRIHYYKTNKTVHKD